MDPQDPGRTVQEEIRAILDRPSSRRSRLAAALMQLGDRRGIEPFRAVLGLLFPLDLTEAEARRVVERVEDHRADLEQKLGRDPGFGVAALDHLHGIEGTLREPVFRDSTPAALPAAPESEIASLDAVGQREARRGERSGRPVALITLAPDAGGAAAPVMDAAAALVRDIARDTDHAGRVLPEGLALVLPCTGPDEALRAAERLRAVLTASTATSWSAGVAACAGSWDATRLAEEARQALRTARSGGGDRSHVFRSERRDHPRRTIDRRVDAHVERAAGGLDGVVEDLSLGGAMLAMPGPLEAGARASLTLKGTSVRGRTVRIAARVARVEGGSGPEAAASWRAAVAFVEGGDGRARMAGLLAELEPAEEKE